MSILGNWTAFFGQARGTGYVVGLALLSCASLYFLESPQLFAANDAPATSSEKTATNSSQNSTPTKESATAPEQALPRFNIQEYRVEGTRLLSRDEIETAVYPFMGPLRSSDDVEKARTALEKVYQDKGYQTVSVQVPEQQVQTGIIVLKVVEAKVGRLRVKGSRYFGLDEIKADAPSLKEGKVVNFNDFTKDIQTLNQYSDRRVTPALKAGSRPETVDVDLNVKDSYPMHGSVELNNRYSADTPQLRLNGAASYANLWQMGHTLGLSFQVAPENINLVKVFSGYYSAKIPDVSWLTLMLQATKQDSKVNSLSFGGFNSNGNGEIIGPRLIFTLPPGKDYYHSITLGIDYKHFTQETTLGGSTTNLPITYYPMSVLYSGSWIGKGCSTELNSGVNFGLRGLGDGEEEYTANRANTHGSFAYVRGDLSHTHDLPALADMQLYLKAQGQAAGQALINNEQFSGGGLQTVRGYLESEKTGDNAFIGTIELRSPSFGKWIGDDIKDWRVYVFTDGGWLSRNDAAAGETLSDTLGSVGVGSSIRMLDHLNGSVDLARALTDPEPINSGHTRDGTMRLTFRASAEF